MEHGERGGYGGDSVGRAADDLVLMDLSLVCSIHDIQGKGLADAGDRMGVTAPGADTFDPDTTYTLSIDYTITRWTSSPRPSSELRRPFRTVPGR